LDSLAESDQRTFKISLLDVQHKKG